MANHFMLTEEPAGPIVRSVAGLVAALGIFPVLIAAGYAWHLTIGKVDPNAEGVAIALISLVSGSSMTYVFGCIGLTGKLPGWVYYEQRKQRIG